MRKASREIIAIAKAEGVEGASIEHNGGRHPKLHGTVDGHAIKLPVSVTKAFATARWKCATKLAIRRAVAEVRA